MAGPLCVSGNLSNRLNPTHPSFDVEFKTRWDGMTRSQRKSFIEEDAAARFEFNKQAAGMLARHPFHTDEADHCETPREAFEDIAPALRAVIPAPVAGVEGASPLRIYDGYYCAGAAKRHLASVGFSNVYNEPEDFYATVRDGKCPAFDCFVTNPAYSGDHICRMLEFLSKNLQFKDKPCFLLMPNYVCAKPYWAAFEKGSPPGSILYLFPSKRYSYWTPVGLRSKKQGHVSADGGQHRTSPFISFWYVRCANRDQANEVAKACIAAGAESRASRGGLSVAKRLQDLPKSIRPSLASLDRPVKGAEPIRELPVPPGGREAAALTAPVVGQKRKRPMAHQEIPGRTRPAAKRPLVDGATKSC